jgi:hypothetical protein
MTHDVVLERPGRDLSTEHEPGIGVETEVDSAVDAGDRGFLREPVQTGALCRERRPRILAMAPDTVAWSAGYDGKFGSPILSWMPGSAWDGRMNQYVNFASCNAMMASTPTMFISANRWAALRSPRR